MAKGPCSVISGISIGKPSSNGSESSGSVTTGMSPSRAAKPSALVAAVAPSAARTRRSPTAAVRRTWLVWRPTASTSTWQSMRSPTSADPANCTVVQSASRPVSASNAAMVSAMPVPPNSRPSKRDSGGVSSKS